MKRARISRAYEKAWGLAMLIARPRKLFNDEPLAAIEAKAKIVRAARTTG
jgi:hypothetical protein